MTTLAEQLAVQPDSAPRTPAPSTVSDTQLAPWERRRHLRFDLNTPIQLRLARDGSLIEGVLCDVSKGGCLFEAQTRFEREQPLRIRFCIAGGGQVLFCSARGRIVRVQDDRRYGVQFTEINHAFAQFMSDMEILRPELRSSFLATVMGTELLVE